MAVKKATEKSAVKLWTKDEINKLKKEYPKTSTKELAKNLKRTLEAVRFQVKKYGLKKTKGYMESLYSSARKPAAKKKADKKKTKR